MILIIFIPVIIIFFGVKSLNIGQVFSDQKKEFYFSLEQDGLLVKQYRIPERLIPYKNIKNIFITRTLPSTGICSLFIKIEQDKKSNFLLNAYWNFPFTANEWFQRRISADIPGIFFGVLQIPYIKEEYADSLIERIIAACKENPPQVIDLGTSFYFDRKVARKFLSM